VLGLWLLIGLGILAKGPITPMVAGLTVLALGVSARRWKWILALRPLLGLLIIAALVGPWVYLVGERVGWRGEHGYLATVYNETIGRSVNSRGAEGHWGPPGYHLVLLVVLMWPGSMLTALGLRWAWMRSGLMASRRRGLRALRADEPALFLLAWIIPSWIVFELISTKLPHYTMPLYPALCLLSARAVYAAETGTLPGLHDRLTRIGLWVWTAFGLVLSVFTFWRVQDWRGGRYVRASHYAILGVVITSVIIFELIVPRYTTASPAIAATLRAIDPSGSRPVAAVGYHEDSLVFLTRGRLVRLDLADASRPALAEAGDWLRVNPQGIVLVNSVPIIAQGRKWTDESREGVRLIDGRNLIGLLNYSKGERVDVLFYESAGGEK
jgi:4-amino-4-deoxy-L-arabinose transferase-like glycosyltransferase